MRWPLYTSAVEKGYQVHEIVRPLKGHTIESKHCLQHLLYRLLGVEAENIIRHIIIVR